MNVKKLIIIILLLGLPKLSQCQEKVEDKIISRLKSIQNSQMSFYVSMPSLDRKNITNSNWPIKQFVIVKDSEFSEYCMDSNAQKAIPSLIKLLDNKEYDWNTNLLLYFITEIDGGALIGYVPNRVDSWRKNQKKSDLKLWHAYLRKQQHKKH